MTGPDRFEALLAGENDRVEYKETARQRDAILQAVCAMANDLSDSRTPGFVVIGIDKGNRILGLPGDPAELDEQQRVLADRLRSSKIQPVPSATIEHVVRDGHHLLVVQVAPYPVPPIVEVDGIAWIRVGSTTRRAVDADLTRLRERRPEHSLPFDTRPLHGCSLSDLGHARLRTEWAVARDLDGDRESFPSFERWLTQRQLGRTLKENWHPNATGMLLFGISPQDFLPCATIDLVRYAGVERDAYVIARRVATGTIPDQLDVAWAWLSAQNDSVPNVSEGLRESFGPRYPTEALKELVRNLAQHRLYEGTNAPGRIEWFGDRIEFTNPGGPFGRASEGEFGAHSDYRNPLITKHLVELGYVQQLGRGVRRVRILLQQNGNPPLESQTDGFTRVVIRSRG